MEGEPPRIFFSSMKKKRMFTKNNERKRQSVCLSVYLYLSVCLCISVCMFVYFCLSVYLSVSEESWIVYVFEFDMGAVQ